MDIHTLSMAFISLSYQFLMLISVPPFDSMIDAELASLWNAFAALFHGVLCSSIFDLPAPNPRLQTLMFPDLIGDIHLNPRNLFDDLVRDPPRLFRLTGETPESLMMITRDLEPYITNQGPGRRHLHRPINRILMALIWLRQYPTYDVLAALFNMNAAAVTRDIYSIVTLLWYYFQSNISWPRRDEWIDMRGQWDVFPNAVGAIDGTLHEIQRPQSENQEDFYSGYSRYHCMSTQIIIDNRKNIRFVQSGFLGHQNDAGQYHLMPSIGPDLDLDFPENTCILGDNGYANRYPVMTRYRRDQLQHVADGDERMAMGVFNEEHSRCRIYIEHVMGFFKTYRAVKGVYRHPRWLMPIVAELCACLAQRHLRLTEHIH